MKSAAASLAAFCAIASYGSSVLAAPIDGPVSPPNPVISSPADTLPPAGTTTTNTMTQEDAAIWGGIRHGVKEGLQTALAENLGISVSHDLVREEEVDQVLDCIGDVVINKMVGCIKTEHLAMQAVPGGQQDESKHTESIQKCISSPTLEHVEYCVGKLEIQRLGEDAHILQELYNGSQLKDSEYIYEHPGYASASWPGSRQGTQTEMLKATDPLFSQSWYEMHKESANDYKPDRTAALHNDADLMAQVVAKDDSKPDSTPAIDPTKATNSTAAAPTPDDANKANNSTTTPDAKPSTGAPLPVDVGKDNNKDGSMPLVKRKFGYGPDYLTAVGVRDKHPLPRRAVLEGDGALSGEYPAALSDDSEDEDGDTDDSDGRVYRIRSSLVGVSSS